ncbi:hypothetical protein H0H93_001873 [Arthromyces matolae]|nr:hypothetical protein H0H93_001873 [Arthromyces matolae]
MSGLRLAHLSHHLQITMSASESASKKLVAFVKQIFGTSLIGFTIATTLYGITCLQTYLYFRKYPKDGRFLKLTVGVLCFYSRTLWRVGSTRPIPAMIIVLALTALALGIVTTVHLFENPLATSISDRKFSILSGLVQGFASLNDIIITLAMCLYLNSQRPMITSPTQHLVDTLMLYSVSRGVLTAVTQILFLVLNVALPHDTYWQPFHQAVGKLYVNSVLATLNLRSSLTEANDIKLGGIQFVPPSEVNTTRSMAENVRVSLPVHDSHSSRSGPFNSTNSNIDGRYLNGHEKAEELKT